MEAKTEQLIKTLTQMKGTSGHEGPGIFIFPER